jgi:hypothetical protein
MRCGTYIRKHIESQIQGIDSEEEWVGWEKWEETETDFDVRAGDRYAIYSFYMLSAVYYIVCVWLAVSFAFNVCDLAGIGALLAYGLLGIRVALLLHGGIRLCTTTKGERSTDPYGGKTVV